MAANAGPAVPKLRNSSRAWNLMATIHAPHENKKARARYVHTSALTDGTRGASLRSTRVCTGYSPSGTHFSLGFKTGFWAQNQLSTCYTEMKLHEKSPTTGRTFPQTTPRPQSHLTS